MKEDIRGTIPLDDDGLESDNDSSGDVSDDSNVNANVTSDGRVIIVKTQELEARPALYF